MAGISLTCKIYMQKIERLKKQAPAAGEKTGHLIATHVAKDTSEYVPADKLSLDKRTRVIRRYVIYEGPYARVHYAGKVMVDAKTGKGPMHYVDKSGNEVIKFRKGATLKPTSRDMEYSKDVHRKAQAEWYEASKAANLKKWKAVGAKGLMYYAGF